MFNPHSYLCVCVGDEARRVYDNAVSLLNRLIDTKGLWATGIVGFWRAQSQGDDILVYDSDVKPSASNHIASFYGLRQQVRSFPWCCGIGGLSSYLDPRVC